MSISDREPSRVPRRRDARESHDRLISAAQREFTARGVNASLERIARDAEVSIGTLYRHFPTRLDLLMAALRPQLGQFLEGATSAMEIDDPWNGFVYYLENLFRVQAGDRGFNDFLSRRFPGNAETERIHDLMCQQIDDVLTRAQDAGAARPDITLADIVNLIWSNGRMIDATNTTAPNAWRRHLYLMLDAYRAERAHPIPEPPMTEEQLYDAMVHLSEAS
ncbi:MULTISPECIES: TetR/AcrR family transcriptional regulator [Subtercola]|uniref:TetR/AcrR family transcriptional regulator n=1 Tax=Subtercola vilae TaxID=2056433 RepID=A0A4T2CDP7_9MICO|nr:MULTISPECIES: TetR/AcrR family transcriptional regulator [Subtercola]MEA9984888.1 helix-turn-helix domain-containing protein [Subtercola sp. RTI3]TIH40448.1 TetR/AcrR family transcriptional regulator [Subtercola vilae]